MELSALRERVAFVCGICCLGNMVSSRKYSMYLSTLNTLRCDMSYIGLFGFLALLEGGTIKVSAENTQDGTAAEEEICGAPLLYQLKICPIIVYPTDKWQKQKRGFEDCAV